MLTRADLDAEQIQCITFIASGEDSLICADVGTGKTVIALTAADEALAEGEVHRWLVLAPKLVATDTWQIEPGEWEHLRHLSVAIACGNEKQRTLAVDSGADIVVMNYENLQWLLSLYPRPRTIRGVREIDTLPFDGLICDEIDKLKDVSAKRFKTFRERIRCFRKRIGLTGTLIPNKLTEAWGQTFIIDGGESFGRSFYEWRRLNFYPTDYQQRKWAPFPNTRADMIDTLSSLAFRLKAKGLPPVIALPSHRMTLPPEIRERYNKLEKDFFLTLPDEHGRTRKVDAANSAVLSGKLQQICAGFSYVDKTKEAVWHSRARFDWLDALLREYSGDQMLIFYHFNEEKDELLRRYPNIDFLGGGVSNKKARARIAAWNAGEIDKLALHPGSAGHGLNLQKSAAHRIAFLTMPWSGGMYKQIIGRLCRRGQLAEQIFVHTALFRNTIDEEVFGTVTGKLSGMEDFLDELELATAA
jgi:SNF2 family DNA or RNA helicase